MDEYPRVIFFEDNSVNEHGFPRVHSLLSQFFHQSVNYKENSKCVIDKTMNLLCKYILVTFICLRNI